MSTAEADPRTETPHVPSPLDDIPSKDDHLVLDADSSQYRAIETAVAQRHVVIDGTFELLQRIPVVDDETGTGIASAARSLRC
jgi:hypothetical protein